MSGVPLDGIVLSTTGNVSSENGNNSIFSIFSSLGHVIQNTTETIAGTAESVFGAINRIETAIDGRGKNPTQTGGAPAKSGNVIQSALPSGLQSYASTNNLLVLTGVGLGLAGILLVIKG